jgi:hypothetical protein
MLLNTDYVAPAELTGYVRAAAADQPVNRFVLRRWLPDRLIDDLQYRFRRGGEGLIEAAAFRAWDAESPIGARVGVTRVTGDLPPISRKVRLGEYDRLVQRRAGTDAIRNELLTDAERMARAVAARMELARGDALVNGSVTITENGLVGLQADFGRAGGHSVTAAISWATASTDVLVDMLTWRDTYVATNGVEPGAMVFSRTVLGYLQRNTALRTQSATVVGAPSIISESTLQALFQANGLPPYYLVDSRVNVSGVATRIIPADVFLYLPEPTDDPDGTDLGATLWGTTAEALDPRYELADDEPGIVAGVYGTEDPIAMWTKAAGVGLPVLANPNLSFKADVVP